MRYCQQKLFITPFLLVGTQSDLRHDRTSLNKLTESNVKPITSRQGEKLANELGAVKYVECSALTQVCKKSSFTFHFTTQFSIMVCFTTLHPAVRSLH